MKKSFQRLKNLNFPARETEKKKIPKNVRGVGSLGIKFFFSSFSLVDCNDALS